LKKLGTRLSSSVYLAALCLSVVAAVPAQQGVTDGTVSASSTESIVLDTVITDKSGARIAGLKAEDITVFDNKQRQTATVTEVAAAAPGDSVPVEAYVVVDEINTPMAMLANERNDFTAYFKRVKELPVPTALVFFTVDGLKFQKEPSRDPAILMANLEANPTTAQAFRTTDPSSVETSQTTGSYYTLEAQREKSLQAMNVLGLKLAKRPGRKLVIWMSPGWGDWSFQGSRMSRKNFEDLFSYEAGLSTLLRVARITLYSVDSGGTDCSTCTQHSRYKGFVKGPASSGDADQNDLMLQALVSKSGGKVLFGRNDMAGMVDECLKDVDGYYVITYPAPATPHQTTFHEIKVQVQKPGAQVRTRWGYFALPKATSGAN
jgi:VWFA-related protein